MSKLDIRIGYKDACILKHALRDKIEVKEGIKDDDFKIVLATSQEPEVYRKELEEEKRTLERFTEQIEECGFKHNRNMFKEKK